MFDVLITFSDMFFDSRYLIDLVLNLYRSRDDNPVRILYDDIDHCSCMVFRIEYILNRRYIIRFFFLTDRDDMLEVTPRCRGSVLLDDIGRDMQYSIGIYVAECRHIGIGYDSCRAINIRDTETSVEAMSSDGGFLALDVNRGGRRTSGKGKVSDFCQRVW